MAEANWTSIDMENDDNQHNKSSPSQDSGSPDSKPIPRVLAENAPKKFVVPSAKRMRQDTLEGIKIGKLPEYQDYTVVLQYLVKQFLENDFKFYKVRENVPWLSEWLGNPFNANLLNEELELAARMEASRIHESIDLLLRGGCCSRTYSRICELMWITVPCMSILFKVLLYFTDLCYACMWVTCCDWWLGVFCRRYILTTLCYIPIYIKIKLENCFIGENLFSDEDLSIRNIYDSNSYHIANQYACLLLLTTCVMMLGCCMIIVSYIYLSRYPDQFFIRVESVLGICLLCVGLLGLQFYCRCTL